MLVVEDEAVINQAVTDRLAAEGFDVRQAYDGTAGVVDNQSFGRTSAPLLEISRGDGGEDNPLGWGYVSELQGVAEGGAELKTRRKFTWTPAPAEAMPELKIATLLAQ